MPSKTVANIQTNVTAKDAGFTAELKRMQGQVDKLSKASAKTKRDLNAMQGAGVAAGNAMAKSLVTAAAGAVSLQQALSFAWRGMKEIADLPDTALSFGVATNELQALRYAAKFAGIELEEMDRALFKAIRLIADARKAGKEGEAARSLLGEVGLAASDFAGMNSIESFQLMVDALSRVPDDLKRADLVMEMLGVKAGKFTALVTEGVGKLNAGMSQAADAGAIVSTADALQAEKIDEMTAAKTQAVKVKTGSAWSKMLGWIIKNYERDQAVMDGLVARMNNDLSRVGLGFGTISKESFDFVQGDTPEARAAERARMEQLDADKKARTRAGMRAIGGMTSAIGMLPTRGGTVDTATRLAEEAKRLRESIEASTEIAEELLDTPWAKREVPTEWGTDIKHEALGESASEPIFTAPSFEVGSADLAMLQAENAIASAWGGSNSKDPIDLAIKQLDIQKKIEQNTKNLGMVQVINGI